MEVPALQGGVQLQLLQEERRPTTHWKTDINQSKLSFVSLMNKIKRLFSISGRFVRLQISSLLPWAALSSDGRRVDNQSFSFSQQFF